MNLNIRRRVKRRLPERVKQTLSVPTAPNQMWSIDFMTDRLVDGRKFRLLNVIDDFNRGIIGYRSRYILPSLRVIRVLEKLTVQRGCPANIRCDNGPEFISHKLEQWCSDKSRQISLQFIQPGKPMQNAYIERKTEVSEGAVGCLSVLQPCRSKSYEWTMAFGLQYRTTTQITGLFITNKICWNK